jgi:heme exporter protein C
MRKAFIPLTIVTAAMFAYAPIAIAHAPYESTMGLVQKIFYFHVPSWIGWYCGIITCGVASGVYLFTNRAAADRLAVSAAEITVMFGLIGLVTGPLWGRKAWGVWWVWDPRLTISLLVELIFVSYLLVRAYGGPGSDKLAAAVGLFGMVVSPFVYVAVNIWRTVHPLNTVVPNLLKGSMPGGEMPFELSALAFVALFALLLALRVELAKRQAMLDELYLADEEGTF